MKRYLGTAGVQEWEVTVQTDNAAPLLLDKGYQHGVNHSPDGFAWGYLGSGPAQLAFAILCEQDGPEIALRNYQKFKAHVIAKLPMDQDFVLEEADVTRGGWK